ncbi:hypothetical protein [Algivirga pacifica]|uniref:Uncharacterized protein n=1 Tax=Algivirga pacifica TaxID=1162670 RepID=A0ABP9DER5_9BACT
MSIVKDLAHQMLPHRIKTHLTPKTMERFKGLLKEITDLTFKIERDYPELYQYLDENPITIGNSPHPSLDLQTMKNYLESLKTMLERHIDSHTGNNKAAS